VQAKADFSSSVAVPIGLGNQCNIHAPTPNNAYFTSITSAGALMYVSGVSTTGTVNQPCTAASGGTATVELYAATFTATGVMTRARLLTLLPTAAARAMSGLRLLSSTTQPPPRIGSLSPLSKVLSRTCRQRISQRGSLQPSLTPSPRV